MKINNCIDCPDHFLRQIIVFCCSELGVPLSYLSEIAFYHTRKSRRPRIRVLADGTKKRIYYPCYSGRAYLSKKTISVRMSPDADSFPAETYKHRNGLYETLADRVEALVYVTAHEVAHHEQYIRQVKTRRGGRPGGSEVNTDRYAFQVLRVYRDNRDALLAKWSTTLTATIKPKKPKATAVEQREKNARDLLEKWERKLKLAKTKVAKYRKKVAYYDRKNIAATKNI